MVKTRIEVFPDIPDLIDFFEAVPEYDVAMYTHKKMKTNPEISLEVLNKIIPVLEAHEDTQTMHYTNYCVDLQKKTDTKTDRFCGRFVPHFQENR